MAPAATPRRRVVLTESERSARDYARPRANALSAARSAPDTSSSGSACRLSLTSAAHSASP